LSSASPFFTRTHWRADGGQIQGTDFHFDLRHLSADFTSDSALLREFLWHSAGVRIGADGRFLALTPDEVARADAAVEELAARPERLLARTIAWKRQPPIQRTLSPFTDETARQNLGMMFRSIDPERESTDKEPFAEYFAPWHPLIPLFKDRSNPLFDSREEQHAACGETLALLRSADRKAWNPAELADDARLAAKWMRELGFDAEAAEAIQLASPTPRPP